MNPEKEHPLNALTEQTTEEERKKQIYAQKALRTFEGDIREAVQEKNASTASMVMAEQAKAAESPAQTQSRKPSNVGKKLLIVITSILLVVVGIGGIYYLYLKSPLAPSAPTVSQTVTVPSIVSPDAQKTLDISGLGSGAIRSAMENALSNTGNGNGSILQIIPTEKDSAGTENIIDASDFLTLIGLSVPNVLFRSLNSQWMLGTYDDNGSAAPFMILTEDFFQNAYAGMISWESTMPDDFANMFGYANKAEEQPVTNIFASSSPATSTATSSKSAHIFAPASTSSSTSTTTTPAVFVSTPSMSSYFNIQGGFRDGVAENKDVRAFYKSDGTMLILYSFVDNNTIVITTDENALTEIINRLEKQTFIR
jgi:hypothetical protein